MLSATPGPINRLTCRAIRMAIEGHDHAAKMEVRSAFRRLQFSEQAALIAEHARQQTQMADSTIKLHWPQHDADLPEVHTVWQKMICSTGRSFTENLATSFPKLAKAAPEIANYLSYSFMFWPGKVYPYDEHGCFSYAALFSSPPRSFTALEEKKIDDLSGLPTLGINLKGYADFLVQNYESLKVNS